MFLNECLKYTIILSILLKKCVQFIVILCFLYRMEECYTIAVAKAIAQPVRQRLVNKGFYDQDRKIVKNAEDELEIPVRKEASLSNIRDILHDFQFRIVSNLEQPVLEQECLHHTKNVHEELKAHLTQVIL